METRVPAPVRMFIEMNSPHGHDAFLVEHEAFAQALKRFLNCLRQQDCGTAAA